MPRQGKRSPKPSKEVAELIGVGWPSACDGLAVLNTWKMERRPGEGPSHFIDIAAGKRRIQVYISPTGQSVRVYVDHDEVEW